MPNSYSYFKSDVKQWFIDNVPPGTRILDVGPGQGTYADLLKHLGYKMDAVEVWAPYVDQFDLKSKYDNVYISDICDFDIEGYDFIILGDVLEHLIVENAKNLIKKIDSCSIKTMVAVPYRMPQDGAEYGNEYETHLQEDLTPEVMLERYPSLELKFANEFYGYYFSKQYLYEKAYVLYATESYKDTVQACVHSIKAVSNIPIIVYMLNSNVQIDGAHTINWSCNAGNVEQNNYIDRSNSEIYQILIQRPAIVKNALNLAKTVAYIDSDSIATKHVDTIFDYFPENNKYPYFVEGVYDWMILNGRGGAESRDDLSTTLEHAACELFGVDQYVRDKYRQTGYFVAGQWCKEFLDDWMWMCNHPKVLRNPQWYAPYHEETIANVLLWKNKQLNGLPYIYINGSLNIVNNVTFVGHKEQIDHFVVSPASEDQLLFYHGEKNSLIMNYMIKKLQETKKSKMKILYVAPHLSTGGMPQYLYEQILKFVDSETIEVVDMTNSGGDSFIVQKDRISKLVKVHTKPDLLKLVNEFEPDIIHYHEIPQDFLTREVLNELFKADRKHFNVVTTHSSYADPDKVTYYPDRYVFVCEWSKKRFEHLGIDSIVWEHPISGRTIDKAVAMSKLGFDPSYKHVLHVGLFTPGKNQGELFEIARMLEHEKIMFHFVGNQAGNFKDYWEPLMKERPKNCIVWGERDDVYTFYSAADLFYFPSKFELAPISITEALGHGLDCMFRKLHTYLNKYDNNEKVTYISENVKENAKLLLQKLIK